MQLLRADLLHFFAYTHSKLQRHHPILGIATSLLLLSFSLFHLYTFELLLQLYPL